MATQNDWDRAGGLFCPQCNQETVRLINGVCPTCAKVNSEKASENIEEKSTRNYIKYRLREGTLSLPALRSGQLGN